MLYQLPNGKVLHLSIDEYLSISDDELNYLVQNGKGEDPPVRIASSGTTLDIDIDYTSDEDVDKPSPGINDIPQEY